MSRILILSWDGGGNTPSAFNLGARLVRRGHRVRMLGWETMAVRAAASGLEFTTYPSVPPWPAHRRHEDGWHEIQQALFSEATEADVTAEIGSFGADAVVIDCMLTAGHAAARRLDVPVASLVHVRYAPFVHQWGSEVLQTDVVAMLDAAQCVLAVQPPGFDPPEAFRSGATAVGAVLRPGVLEQLDRGTAARLAEPGDPWVLLSLSTTMQGQADVLPTYLQALGSLPVRVLLTLGGVLSPDAVAAPPNVTVRGFLPHSGVLPHMDAVVTHAGMSTVATTLAAGLPMVCLPQGRDQPLNAARVEELGAGLMLTEESVPEGLASAVRTVLGDHSYRTAAQELATKALAVGNGELATDLVDALSRAAISRR
ncbi:MAG: glycosyltransferase [Streptosporangiaceae bacterium]|nr:glycosyltransferase [Streptosporangiaceae bacterium]